MHHFATSFLRQFFKIFKMEMTWDTWRLLCVQKLSFFVIVIVYTFMGLVLQVANPFMSGGKKRSKKP